MSNGLVKRPKSGKRPKYGTIPLNLTNYQLNQISALTGSKIDSLRAWTEAREREIREAAIEEYTEKLHRSEDHATFVNLLISMYAIKMTWGFTKSQARFVENRKWYRDPKFVHESDHTDMSTIEHIVRNIGRRAGVQNVHPHRFRRTGATMALRSGMPLIQVSKLLGHESIGTTQIYLDISDEELSENHRKYVI